MKKLIALNGAARKISATTSPAWTVAAPATVAATGDSNWWVVSCAWLVVSWALLELPWEIGPFSSTLETAAILVSKVFLGVVVWFMLRGMVAMWYVFLLICTTSVLAIAPTLPDEYSLFPVRFVLSTGECLVKIFALWVIGFSGMHKNR